MRATPLPPGALLSRAEWRSLGVSTDRLAGPAFTTVFHGFSTPTSAPASVNTMCDVLQTSVIPGAIISHTTAAALFGISIPWWTDNEMGLLSSASYILDGRRTVPGTVPIPPGSAADHADELPAAWVSRAESGLTLNTAGAQPGPPAAARHLTTPPLLHARLEHGRQRSAGQHVVLHRTSPRPGFTYLGLKMSHPYVVLLVASILPHDEVVIAIDSLVRRDPPVRGVTLEAIRIAADTYGSRWGSSALRKALRDAQPNTDSPGETRTRLLLGRAGFPQPAINHPVVDPDTGQMRYLDLAYPEHRIGVEYDGDYHRLTKKQWRSDQARKDSLASVGWELRTLTGEDIKHPKRALAALHRTFLRAGARAPSPDNWAGRRGALLGRSLRPPASD